MANPVSIPMASVRDLSTPERIEAFEVADDLAAVAETGLKALSRVDQMADSLGDQLMRCETSQKTGTSASPTTSPQTAVAANV